MKALFATILCLYFFSCILEISGVSDESYQNDGIAPPTITVNPNDLIVTSHETIVLNCAVTGSTKADISWYFNDELITESTDRSRVHSNGTLIIENAEGSDSGIYKCVSLNSFGSLKAKANVKVNVLPTIEIAPESHKNIKSGASIVFYCEADGNPKPYISWMKEGRPVTQTNRIYLASENTELHIEHVKETDAGMYVCIAENSNGKTESGAKLTVRSIRGAPKLLVEPYDLEAFPGSKIEIPCKGEGEPTPLVKWKKDGRTITSGAIRYRVSASGSLFITNVTDADTGRYECSLSNEYGRATAHGLVTVKSNEIQNPGDRFVRIAFAEASKEVDMAINQTVSSLFGNHTGQKKHHGDLFRLFRFPTAPARELARAAEIYERTLVNIRKHVEDGSMLVANKSDFNYIDILSTEHLELVARLSGCESHRNMTDCSDMCFHSKYRSIEGTCNNLQNTNWGASLTGFRRVLNPIYENGFSTPIGWTKGKLYHGFVKPSARHISSSLISTKDITPDDSITHMMMQWGQFLDHDLDHAIPSVSSESWDGIDCKKSCEYAAPCYPIEIPPNDPRVKNRRCLDFVRSSAICGSGMTSVFFETIQPREQINQLTAFIDASQVYGYSKDFAKELRNLTTDDGLLREGVTFPDQKPMLPFSSKADGIDCRRNLDESNINCFVAGDIRVNEQIGLLAMHVLWFREHNRIASTLRRINPHWCGETIYQEARKIVGAQMQHITYSHWLPHILGEEGMEILGKYKEYNPNLNPSISNEFATAALRFGHTLINPILHRVDSNFNEIPQGHLPLHKAFFAPWRIVYEGGIDPLMRGLFSVPAKLKMPTQNLNTELTEKLFKTSHAVALDLAAINIQRSRDHAIPGYNEYRRVCNLTYAETFDDLKEEITSEEVRNKLKEIYGHPSNIDIFVGGILEDQVKGGRVGPLFRCLLIDQFQRLRDGDRFFYENPSVFKPEQLTQIKQSSLARALCNNGDNITTITNNVFLLSKLQGGYTSCDNIPKIDLNIWMDCQKCAVENTNIQDKEVLRNKRRQSRLKREIEVFGNSSMNAFEDDDFLIKRIDDLESMVDGFEKTLKEMRKEMKKLEKRNTPSHA